MQVGLGISPATGVASIAAATAAALHTSRAYLFGYTSEFDGGGAWYKKADSEPAHAGKFQDALSQWWELDEAEPNAKMFGAVGDNATDDTSAINDGLAYVGLRNKANRVANKRGSGGTLHLPVGVYRIDGTIQIDEHGVKLRGASMLASVLAPTHATADTILIAGPDPTNANGSPDNTPEGVTISDLAIWRPEGTAGTGAGIHIDRSLTFVERVHFQRVHQCVKGSAPVRGSRIDGCIFTHGTNVATVAGSCAILLDRRQVDASDPQATLDSVDSLYYDKGASVYVDNCQMQNTSGGFDVLVDIKTIDGLYVSNSHLGFGETAIVRFGSSQANLPILNVTFDACFLDDESDTDIGVLFEASGTNNVRDVRFINCEINGAASAAVYGAHPGVERVTFGDCVFSVGDLHGVQLLAGAHWTFDGCQWFDFDNGATTGTALLVNGATDVVVDGPQIFGGAYRGISLVSGDRIYVTGGSVRDCTDVAIRSGLSSDDYSITGVHTDESASVASSNGILVPLGKDKVHITGTTTINNIDAGAAGGKSSFDGRQITLVFDGAATVGTSGNIALDGGTSFTAAAGAVLRVEWDAQDQAWYEIARRVP